MKIQTLKGKLIAITLVLFFVVLFISTAAVAFFVKGQMEEVLLNKSVETATEMSENLTNMFTNQRADISDIQKFLDSKAKQSNVAYAVFIDTDAVAVAHSDPAKIGKTESYGCIRLTNWSARAVADAVKPGTPALLQE